MLVKLYCDSDSLKGALKFIIKSLNISISPMERGELCRSDIVLVLASFFNDPMEDILESHPYNPILAVGLPKVFSKRNITYLEDPEELRQALAVIAHRESKNALPTIKTSSKRQHSKRKKISKSKCPFCQKEIGIIKLGYDKHLVACEEYQSRPAAFGDMVTYRQPGGKSKGSLLTVYIPQNISVNNIYFKEGLHFITSPKVIKILNAVLRDTFRYTLTKRDELY